MKERNGGKQMKSVWRMTAPGKKEKVHGKHPTQKPVALLERILLASTEPGAEVFDPFAGSATTGVAAIRTGRKFTGCEIEDRFLALSIERLESALRDAR